MAVSLREYRARIRSVESTKKITRAMELIAASRIIKAQQRAQAAAPYARELTRAVSALVTYSNVEHPLTSEKPDAASAAVLVITSDRGLAGSYSSSVLKEAERLSQKLRDEGKEVGTYITGRKGEAYFHFRRRPMVGSWTGFSDNPNYDDARQVADALLEAFLAEEGGVDEVHVVYTRFITAGSQEVVLRPLVPLSADTVAGGDGKAGSSDGSGGDYEFEPDPSTILDSLLPRYVEARVYAALLNAAASEHAFRQRAMKSATDNAEELIKSLSRVMNRARQDSITTEIMEIVGGAEALDAGDDDLPYIELGDDEFTSALQPADPATI